MKKNIIIIVLAVIITGLAILLMVNYNKLNQKPVEYFVEIETADFNIRDINFITFDHKLYMAPNYYLELKWPHQKFDGLLITGTIDERRVLDIGIEGDPFHRRVTHSEEYYGEGTLFNNIKIDNDSVIKIHITYTVDKVKKDFYENIKLREKIKPFSK